MAARDRAIANRYRLLEGTFLGGCLFPGRVAGRRSAAAGIA